jgi:hypothetical protein
MKRACAKVSCIRFCKWQVLFRKNKAKVKVRFNEEWSLMPLECHKRWRTHQNQMTAVKSREPSYSWIFSQITSLCRSKIYLCSLSNEKLEKNSLLLARLCREAKNVRLLDVSKQSATSQVCPGSQFIHRMPINRKRSLSKRPKGGTGCWDYSLFSF